jgi:hypothetical protein
MFIQPKEIPEHLDFFVVPGFSRYGISRSGVIVNTETGEKFEGSRAVSGYQRCTIMNDLGRKYCTGVHRLLLLTFKNEGLDYSELQVNHINGIPYDNNLDNLEWVTGSENVQHAHDTGLHNLVKEIEVRDARTDEVILYASIADVAEDVGVSYHTIRYRINLGTTRIFSDFKQYRRKSSEPWPGLSDNYIEQMMLKNNTDTKVLCKFLITGVVREYERITDLANDIGKNLSTVSVWLNRPNQPVLVGGILLKYKSDTTPWRVIETLEDMFRIYNESNSESRVVQVTNDLTGLSLHYWTAKQAADAHGISVTALDYRLKSQGAKVFKDGCRYGYFPF